MLNKIEIASSEETLQKFKNHYSILSLCDIFSQKELIDNLFEKYTSPIEFAGIDKLVNFDDIKIGDCIKIWYCTYSQSYYNYYEKKNVWGIVIFIDKENEDILMIKNDDNCFTLCSMEQLGCSYYGTNKGYDPMILKL
jgi:hypothetical protein